MQKGLFVMLAGPSGCGKSTLIRRFLDEHGGFSFPVSATTRSPRPGEVEGVSYHFLKREDFEQRIAAGEFLEHAEVFGNLYGTLRATVEKGLDQNLLFIKDVDIDGARSLMANICNECLLSLFIAPPSLKALEARLRGRGSEDPASLERRLARVREEMDLQHLFGHVIVNDELDRAYGELCAITEQALVHGQNH
ncbi:MAG: guanylate kinase [Planctomycetes bacterium]|nr:guanylate kinase [Planctomycetota bacterium]